MKTYFKKLFVLPLVVAAIGWVLAGKVTAQTFTTLYSFTGGGGGAFPLAGLVLSSNTLYGTTFAGGNPSDLYGNGTLFAVNIQGTGFTTVYSFTATPFPGPYTNSDGAGPSGDRVLSGNTLYGTAVAGGAWESGTVFALKTDGTGFTTLYNFTASGSDTSGAYTNSDGTAPNGLILSGNTLYGTAQRGGSSGNGTVFKLNTDGTGFTTLYDFRAGSTNSSGFYTNSDGSAPIGRLISSGNTLYGTAYYGGAWGNGTLFAVNTDGTGFKNLHSFTEVDQTYYTNSDGANPQGSLILSGNSLYGTAERGGSPGPGTVFSLRLPPPQLTIITSGANVILTWPANFTGFTLQSATNLSSPIWTTNLTAPVVLNGQYTVTNPISGTQQFFRLSQ